MPIGTLEASNSLQVAKELAGRLPITALDSDKSIYTVLVALSFDWIEDKAYRVVPAFVTFHSSLTLVAAVAGIDRVTAWRSLRRLKAIGLVDWRSHKCMFRGRASNSGSLFQLRLNPSAGSRAKLSYDDLKHEWKNLEKAARAKRLSCQTMQLIKDLQDQLSRYLLLREWTLKPYTQENPVKVYKLQPRLEDVLDVKNVHGKQVNEVIDAAAVALGRALQDSSSTDFYRKLLWSLRRRYSATGKDEFYTLYQQVNRVVKADMPEWGGLRSPGALLTSRLKKYRWYEEEILKV